MATRFSFSPLNPINFTQVSSSQKLNTDYIHFGKDLHEHRLRYYDSQDDYVQKFQLQDRIVILFESTDLSLTPAMNIYNDLGMNLPAPQYNATVLNYDSYEDIAGNVDEDGFQYRTYKFVVNLSLINDPYGNPYGEGFYRFSITDTFEIFVSELIDVKEYHPNTLAIKYSHDSNDFDTIFSMKPNYIFRIDGSIGRLSTENEDTFFEEQDKELVKLKSRPYRNYKIQFGIDNGIPDYIHDKLNYIFSCDNVSINNILFVKDESAKFESNEIQGSPFVGLSLNIRERNLKTPYSYTKSLIELFTIPSYPCFLAKQALTDNVSIVDLCDGVEIANSTELATFVSGLNTDASSLGLNGTFSIVSDTVYYENDEESYVSLYGSSSILVNKIDFQYDIVTISDSVTILFDGGYIGVVYDNIDVIKYSTTTGWTTQSYNGFISTGGVNVRLYISDGVTKLAFSGTTTSNKMTTIAITDALPSQIVSFSIADEDVSSIPSNTLFSLVSDIQFIGITNSGVTTFEFSFLTSFTGGLNSLSMLSLQHNSIDSTNVDNVINEFASGVNYTAIIGSLILDSQSPTAPPTGASTHSKDLLTYAGWLVLTD